MMNKDQRIAALEQVKKEQDSKPYAVAWIRYDGRDRQMNVYEIPLKYLLYNKFNGRILSRSMSYEQEYHELNPERKGDIETIENFLWDSKRDRNELTLKDIRNNGQREHGIVTKDGVVIDGNRRTLMLNKLCSEGITDRCTFRAIILDDELEGKEKEILELETTYQMGTDSKVDYNPIEKYLKCSQMRRYFEIDEIARFMSEEPKRIKEWLQIMKLMEDYLDDLGYNGIYTRLDKREGHFVDLNNYLNRYRQGSTKVKRPVDDSDIVALKSIYFDYIRVPFPVNYCRIIGKPSEKYSFYCHSHGTEIWEEFKEQHEKNLEGIEEKSVDQLREENPGDDLALLLKSRDSDWSQRVKDSFEKNIENVERTLNDINLANAPFELLERARRTLGAIDTTVDTYKTDVRISDAIAQLKHRLIHLENERNS